MTFRFEDSQRYSANFLQVLSQLPIAAEATSTLERQRKLGSLDTSGEDGTGIWLAQALLPKA